MSRPEQRAWKQTQRLALILKPSPAQINSLQREGQRKLLIFTHLFIFRQKIKQLGTVMICPWHGSCKHVSTCRSSLCRHNWKWTCDRGSFPAEYTYSAKESYGQTFFFFTFFFEGKLQKTTILLKRKGFIFSLKLLLNFCFDDRLTSPIRILELKHWDLGTMVGMLKQISSIGCSDAIGVKSLRIFISQEISTAHVVFQLKIIEKKIE